MSRVITFYSYKGGTGRSMALANVAWILASRGKRVLTIDWDLEAPGLHRYFHPFLNDKELTGQESQGLIDMALDYAVSAATPTSGPIRSDDQWIEARADFSKWSQKLRWPSGERISLGKDGAGKIEFVSAGRRGPEYAQRVNLFDGRGFYENLGGGGFFDSAKRKLDSYDYVLIDSRTGVSDTSGICTVHMPDTLVICFTLNHQSINGAAAIAESVKRQRPDISIFPVATRVDGSESQLLNHMKNYAERFFNPFIPSDVNLREYWFAMEVPYFARYAYAETLSIFEEQSSISASTLPAFERLCEYLTDGEVRSSDPLPPEERAAVAARFNVVNSKRQPPEPSVVTSFNRPPAVKIVVYITSAPGDREIAEVLKEAILRLDDLRFSVFLQHDVVGPRHEPSKHALDEAHFLIAIVPLDKRTVGWTGYEIGYFLALMESESPKRRSVKRKFFPLQFCGRNETPQHYAAFAVASLIVEIVTPFHQDSGLDVSTRMFLEIDEALFEVLADKRDDLEYFTRRRRHILELVEVFIYPALILAFESRVNLIFEHMRMELALPVPPSGVRFSGLTADVRLTMDQGLLRIFGFSDRATSMTWDEFRSSLLHSGRGSSLPDALEHVVGSAIAWRSSSDSSVIVRAYNDQMFRIVLERRVDYYNGRKLVRLLFLDLVAPAGKEDDVSKNLAAIGFAAKIKSLFEPGNVGSTDTFVRENRPERFCDRVVECLARLRAIELDAAVLGLDHPRAVSAFYGAERDDPEKFSRYQAAFLDARHLLEKAAQSVLSDVSEGEQFLHARERFVQALEAFQASYEMFASVLSDRALVNLNRALGGNLHDPGLPTSAPGQD